MKLKFLLLLGGLIVVIIRIIISRLNSSSHKTSVQRFQNNPKLAVEFSDTLDIPYGVKTGYSFAAFKSLVEKLTAQSQEGSFKIAFTRLLSQNKFLVMTEIEFEDFDTNVLGKGSDVKKEHYHNFLISFHPETNELSVNSELYSNSTEKFQKHEFGKRVMSL